MYEAEIKQLISMPELITRYGIREQNGFVCCPVHDDNKPSCKIYPGSRGWYCFSCGTGGDVLDFAQNYFGLPKSDAVRKLNADFSLNLPLDGYDRKEAERQAQKRNWERQQKRRKIAEAERVYWDLFDALEGIEIVLKAFRPVNIHTAPHPLFIEALKRKEHYEKELEFSEGDLRRLKEGIT